MRTTLNLANQITLARLVLAVVFFALLSRYSQADPNPRLLAAAIAVFAVAAITDFIDGYVARKYGLVTALGRILDPFVDKVLVCGAFILMGSSVFVDDRGTNVTCVSGWMVVVIVGRELLVTSVRGFFESHGIEFASSLHGKLKMWAQCLTAPAVLLIVACEAEGYDAEWLVTAKYVLVWATVSITTLSALQYMNRSRVILRESTSL